MKGGAANGKPGNPSPPYPPQRYKVCPIAAKPMIQHWDGAKWTKHTPGKWSGGTGTVGHVYAVRPGEVYFVGNAGQSGVFMRWNGTSFENAPAVPTGCSGDGGLQVRDGALTVIGYQKLCRLVDGAWQTIPAPSSGSLYPDHTYVGATGIYTTRYYQGDWP